MDSTKAKIWWATSQPVRRQVNPRGSTYGWYLCHTLLIMVALIQCSRPPGASVPSKSIADTFPIASANLNPYVSATFPPNLNLSSSASLKTVIGLPNPSFFTHHTSISSLPAPFSSMEGKPEPYEANDFHCHLWCPLDPFLGFRGPLSIKRRGMDEHSR